MNGSYLKIRKVERDLSSGGVESLTFTGGVNLLVGVPNTGKTYWLKTIDFLFGDDGASPFEGGDNAHLAAKYRAARLELEVSGETVVVERKWNAPGVKTKVFVNDVPIGTQEFQQYLSEKLNIPLLHYPRGNPYSGQTWPELSFRNLLRHIYRRQAFWADLADRQYESEQYACLLQFLGLAERIFTDEYGQLVKLKIEVDRLKARREQYDETLRSLALELVSEEDVAGGLTAGSIRNAEQRLDTELLRLRKAREVVLHDAAQKAFPQQLGRAQELGEQRARQLVSLEELRRRSKESADRLIELKQYAKDLSDESERISRADDAAEVLADLRVTHCPACDQRISGLPGGSHCFVCHQTLPERSEVPTLGAARLKFEADRLDAELAEANELLAVVTRDVERLRKEIQTGEESLRSIENELAPLRTAVSGLANEQVAAIDMSLGELNERQKHLNRLKRAVAAGAELTAQIAAKEKEIEPIEAQVNELHRATDFDDAAKKLADGMNEYLGEINKLKPKVWPHTQVTVDISDRGFSIKVGSKKWSAALGGTDSLYFLMAYHYALLALSSRPECHYPGLVILDMPAEFAGEEIKDMENFILQPFIDLLAREEMSNAQLIVTGASFAGLEVATRIELKDVHVAR